MTWIGRLLRRRRLERELDAELRDHMERHVADAVRSGLTDADARRRARLLFGGLDQIKEECRDARGTRLADDLVQDIRYGWRTLLRARGFAAAAVLSLALGIGANTAVFSLVNGLLLRTLPVRDPGRLVQVGRDEWTNPIWEQIDARHAAFADGAAAWAYEPLSLGIGGESRAAQVLWTSGRFFDVLGVRSMLGRLLQSSDDRPTGGRDGFAAVISYRCWQQRFGGAADVVGRGVTIGGVPFTVVGVSTPEFFGPLVGTAFDVAVPIAAVAQMEQPGPRSRLDGRATWWLNIMLRLKNGRTIDDASRALHAIQPAIRQATLPSEFEPDAQAAYLREPLELVPSAGGPDVLRRQFGAPLLAVFAVVGLVLLAGCANLGSLLLARATGRRRELAMRRALGASGPRLVRQLLTESLILSMLGAALGFVLALWASRALVAQLSTVKRPIVLDLSFDWRVAAFTSVVAIASALLFGIVPALRAHRVGPLEALQPRTTFFRRARLGPGEWLVSLQVALSLALVVAALLFVRTFVAVAHVDLGFVPDPVLLVSVDAARAPITPAERVELFARMRAAAAGVPGVASAAVSTIAPVSGMGWNSAFDVAGHAVRSGRDRIAWVNAITPGWFATYGTRLLAGRDFDTHDTAGAPRVAIVNEAFARAFFGTPRPIGRTMQGGGPPGAEPLTFQIVGVVETAVYRQPRDGAEPTVYVSMMQAADDMPPFSTVAVRSAGPSPAALANSVSTVIGGIRSEVSLRVLPLTSFLDAAVVRERVLAIISTFFGGLALLLAAIGLYGVTTYTVSLRRPELGLRVALGAARAAVVRLVVARTLASVLIGVAVGAVATLWAARFLRSLVFGVMPDSLATLAGAAAVLIAVSAAAAWWPAWRAATADPVAVLREN